MNRSNEMINIKNDDKNNDCEKQKNEKRWNEKKNWNENEKKMKTKFIDKKIDK